MKSLQLLFAYVSLCQSQLNKELDSNYWYVKGATELSNAYNVIDSAAAETARNIVLFIGDGMGISTVTAARILKGQRQGFPGEEGRLVFEDFPHVGLIKTYSVDAQVTDSAASATAILTGVKTNNGLLGYNAKVKRGRCNSAKNGTKLSTIAEWAIDAGKDVGVVTTARITHATPAALYANSVERDWECDSKIPKNQKKCKDIGRQLIEDHPGTKLKVIMGGGAQQLQANPEVTKTNPLSDEGCKRTDGKDLIKQWLRGKKNEKTTVVRTAGQLRDVDVEETDYLLGIFANDHLPFEALRDKSRKGVPSLANMTHTALRILNKNTNGYFLLVEGGRIDHAHHNNQPQLALEETLAFEKAVEAALGFVDHRDTLIIVTADHSHGMTLNGYPHRGNPILGMAGVSADNYNVPYTTLLYSSGPGGEDTYILKNGQITRKDLTGVNTSDPDYVAQALVSGVGGAHGGEDVMLYAKGPMSFMFHSLHEQNYIGLAMSFAACIGPTEREFCYYRQTSAFNALHCNAYIVVLTIVFWAFVTNYITAT